MRHWLKVFAITGVITTVFLQTASASMTEFLDDYEEVVSIYEEYSNKNSLCSIDALKLNTEILPKIMPLTQTAQTQQGNFTPTELQRYMEIMNRFSNAMMKIAPKLENITC